MSLELYWRRLVYEAGRGGVVKEGPLTLRIDTPPPIFPLAVELDLGEVHRGIFAYDPIIRDRDGARRDATPPEIIAFRAYMAGLLAVVMGQAKQPPKVETERRK